MSDDVFAVGLPESFGPDDVLVRMGASTACSCGSNTVVATGAPGAPLAVRCAQCGVALPATTASLAAMWPTMPAPTPTEEEKPKDPVMAMLDEISHLAATKGEDWCASMYRQLNANGMTLDRAAMITARMDRRGRK